MASGSSIDMAGKEPNSGTESDTPVPLPNSQPDHLPRDEEDVERQEDEKVPPQGAGGWGSDAPDGGRTAWLMVLGCWCMSFCSFGWINSIGVFQEYYETTLLSSYTPSTIAWIPSLQLFFMMAMGPVVGQLFDLYGPRRIMLVGTFLHVFGLMMASLSTQYYQLLLSQGVCSAIGVACVFQPSINCIPGWWNKKRGMVYGIVATGSSVGGIIFPIMVSRLIASIGYPWAMRATAFMILGLLAIGDATVVMRGKPSGARVTPELMAKPFSEGLFVLLLVGMFILTFGIFVPITYLPVAALADGMDPNLAQYLVAMLNGASLFGRALSGWAADKIGKYNSMAIACYCTGIVCLALWIPATSNAAIIAFAVLFGFFSGAYVALIAALVAQISPLREIGFRAGLVFLVCSVPALVASPVAGSILQHANGNWVPLKVFTGVFALVGTSIVFAARLVATKFKFAAVF